MSEASEHPYWAELRAYSRNPTVTDAEAYARHRRLLSEAPAQDAPAPVAAAD